MEQGKQKLSALEVQAHKYKRADDLSSELFREQSEVWSPRTLVEDFSPLVKEDYSDPAYNYGENH